MISYELAKELKEAGFPQKFSGGHYYAEKYTTFKEAQVAHYFFEERLRATPESELAVSKLISIPNLSELIETIGDDFVSLFKEAQCWTADVDKIDGWREIEARGQTPEEAVAKLWIALNKK